jgi:hypothetical protein
MPVNLHAIGATAAVVALMLFVAYRRVRRAIGRQRLQPVRMKVRVGLLTLVSVAFIVVPRGDLLVLAAAAAGTVLGIALAVYALRHTQYETTADGTFYTGHPYIGLGIALLFVGRLIYRFIQMSTGPGLTGAGARGASPFAGMVGNPVTTGVFFVVAGYYIAYYTGLLRHDGGAPPDGAASA